jgi:hypothetical protein
MSGLLASGGDFYSEGKSRKQCEHWNASFFVTITIYMYSFYQTMDRYRYAPPGHQCRKRDVLGGKTRFKEDGDTTHTHLNGITPVDADASNSPSTRSISIYGLAHPTALLSLLGRCITARACDMPKIDLTLVSIPQSTLTIDDL